jgi:hypothetical protein
MTDTERAITFYVDTPGAEALLTVLRRIGPNEIAMLHDEGIEWATFDKASTRLRTALRDLVEPGWREEASDT